MSGSVSLPALGTLNRALVHVTLASFPALNIGVQNMGKTEARLTFEGDFNSPVQVAVGWVTSPEPYVIGNLSIGVLRTQSVGAAWLAQCQSNTTLGTVTVYPDSASFPSITLSNTVVKSFDPNAMDGTDAVIALVLRGVFFANASMFN